MGLSSTDRKKLEFEVVSKEARLKLTRLLRYHTCPFECSDTIHTMLQNRVINIARNVLGTSVYQLEPDEDGDYHPAEKAWHFGELELSMRRPDTAQLIETLADLLQAYLLDIDKVNEILEEDGSSVHFHRGISSGQIQVSIKSIAEIREEDFSDEHRNIRQLVDRMERGLHCGDFAAVLHASASVFETLAKDVIDLKSIENESLGGFFERYRKDSKLPSPILDYILDIFKRRSMEPLAGHGGTVEPTVTQEQAVVICEMTKAFLRIERQLEEPQLFIDTEKKQQ